MDYKVNGLPVFKVGFNDFSYLSLLSKTGGRFLTRELRNTDLIDYIKKSRSRDFMFDYNGLVIDFSKYKPSQENV